DAVAVGANGACGLEALRIVRRRAVDLLLGPRVSAVPRERDDLWNRHGVSAAEAAEIVDADVDAAEERARRGVVRPDLVLVLERRRAQLWRRKHRRHPAALVLDARLR